MPLYSDEINILGKHERRGEEPNTRLFFIKENLDNTKYVVIQHHVVIKNDSIVKRLEALVFFFRDLGYTPIKNMSETAG